MILHSFNEANEERRTSLLLKCYILKDVLLVLDVLDMLDSTNSFLLDCLKCEEIIGYFMFDKTYLSETTLSKDT